MDLFFGLVGRAAVVIFCGTVLIVACELAREWIAKRKNRKPKLEPLTLFHVVGSKNQYTVPTLDEARDLADWLENDGQLVGFWLEKIEA